jgi:hypothetical protein
MQNRLRYHTNVNQPLKETVGMLSDAKKKLFKVLFSTLKIQITHQIIVTLFQIFEIIPKLQILNFKFAKLSVL